MIDDNTAKEITEIVDNYLNDNNTLEEHKEININRNNIGENEIKPLIIKFFKEKITLDEFKTKNDSLNKKNSFLNKIDFHSRLVNYKLTPIRVYLNELWRDYQFKVNEIYQFCQDNVRINVSFPISQDDIDSLEGEEKNILIQASKDHNSVYLNYIVMIVGLINIIFSALEAECKIFCSLSCFIFSLSCARNEIIHHDKVWKTLRMVQN